MNISEPAHVTRKIAENFDDGNSVDLDDLDLDSTHDDEVEITDANAATEKQVNFARSLYREIRDLGASDRDLDAHAESVELAKSDKSRMSDVIDDLIQDRDARREQADDEIPEGMHVLPNGSRRKVKRSRSSGQLYALDPDAEGDQYLGKRGLAGLSSATLVDEDESSKPSSDFPSVPDGYYAIDSGNGVVKFYKVKTPTDGKWEGFTFVDAQASDELHPIRNAATKREILMTIAEDPEAAAILYGVELGVCGRCGRTLTDEDSRERGLGPICADKPW